MEVYYNSLHVFLKIIIDAEQMADKKTENLKKSQITDELSSYFKRKMSGKSEGSADSLLNCRVTMLDIQQVFPVKKQDYLLHIHKEYEIIIPRTTYHCQLNGAEVAVSRGELLLLQPGDAHMDHLDPDEAYDSFRFTCQFPDQLALQAILKKDVSPVQQKTSIKNFSSIQCLCDLIWDEIKDGERMIFPAANGIFQGLFWKILIGFDEQLLNENLIKKSKTESDVQKFLDVLHRHLTDFPDISKLSREIGMSRSALARFSLENFNHPPLRMLMYYKMKYAKECLDCIPGIMIKELSDKLGFSNQFHFTKVYKRFFGTAPSAYVKKRKY